jgi:hypothetical protein
MSQKRSVCYNAQAVLGKLQVVVEGDWRVYRSVGGNGVMEEDQSAKEGSMLEECCAVQALTTGGIGIDVEIDQCRTVPPSNYDLKSRRSSK